MEIPAPQDFLSILHQVCDKVIKVSVFTCFLATAVTIIIIIIIIIIIMIIIIIIINNPFLLHENYVPLIKFKFKFILIALFKFIQYKKASRISGLTNNEK